ncbi:MAG TPA: hypothetical protein VEI99_07230, partial [Terriglobales bacterium]|nr:hypothetical protein [Terriglobales bacterium]
HILGSDGTIEHGWSESDMVNGEEGESIRYYPEKVNRPRGAALVGKSKDQDHMGNWIDCVRTRKTPNAPVEIGYRSAIAVHMANLAYRHRQRMTLEEAKAVVPEF